MSAAGTGIGADVADKLAVAETIYRYAVGIDTRDFDLYRSIFADEVQIDFSSYNGSDSGPAPMSADQWVAAVRPQMVGLSATQHSMTNPLVEVTRDLATCRMYMQAHHVYRSDDQDSWFTIGGYYDDTLFRSADGPTGWLLSGVTLTVLWRRGDPAIMPAARARGVARLGE
jgi:hypothetical protein